MTDPDRRCGMTAVISADGRYRYRLHRTWDADKPTVLWIMLNPSTADADVDDPTIRRCLGFSFKFGYGSMSVGNLYAFRSTDPAVLWSMAAMDARGPDNAKHIQVMASESKDIICAWGVGGGSGLSPTMQALNRTMHCLGLTKHGAPRHPLYVGRSVQLTPYWHSRAATAGKAE